MSAVEKKLQGDFNERLTTSGFRFTPQRQHVYDVILHKRDHPTAEEVFIRAKKTMPEISHATVYNSLDALVKCGLVRQVQLERGATRFCPNMEEHCHYYCDKCRDRKVSKWIITTSPFTAFVPIVRRKNNFTNDEHSNRNHRRISKDRI